MGKKKTGKERKKKEGEGRRVEERKRKNVCVHVCGGGNSRAQPPWEHQRQNEVLQGSGDSSNKGANRSGASSHAEEPWKKGGSPRAPQNRQRPRSFLTLCSTINTLTSGKQTIRHTGEKCPLDLPPSQVSSILATVSPNKNPPLMSQRPGLSHITSQHSDLGNLAFYYMQRGQHTYGDMRQAVTDSAFFLSKTNGKNLCSTCLSTSALLIFGGDKLAT